MGHDDIQDVKFEDINTGKHIKGKILYFSTSQVADILEESDSKIRYYTSVFDKTLNISISNKQRRYTDEDIEKLKFILELKNSGMTIKQIQEYISEVSFNEDGIQIKESNPLSIQSLAQALIDEQHKQMLEFKKEIIETISNQLKNQIEIIQSNNEKLKDDVLEQVSISVDLVVDDKLNSVVEKQKEIRELNLQHSKELKDFVATTIQNEVKESLQSQMENLKSHIDLQEQAAQKRDNEKMENMRKHLEEQRQLFEKKEKEEQEKKHKGLLGKIFNK